MPYIPEFRSVSRKGGRPEIQFDWELVDEILEAGSPGTEAALAVGISPDTLYDRCLKEKKMIFSDYAAQKRAKGDCSLRVAQYRKALYEDGDNTQLIWLGKQRLGQREPSNNEHNTQIHVANLQELMNALQVSREGHEQSKKGNSLPQSDSKEDPSTHSVALDSD